MNFSTRSHSKELIDRTDIPFTDIERNMHELNIINTWLGGHAISIKGLKQLLSGGRRLGEARQTDVSPVRSTFQKDRTGLTSGGRRLDRAGLTSSGSRVSICEIGCGGGDNLAALYRYCSGQQIATTLTGVDYNPHCIAVARRKFQDVHVNWITADYRDLRFGNSKPDIIFSSLFCHHFTDEELIGMLQWMDHNTGTGWFINDLHRHPLAYYSIRWLTGWLSRSYLVRHDAPLSVRRGFSRGEWKTLLQQAGITDYSLRWEWAFRWLVIGKHEVL